MIDHRRSIVGSNHDDTIESVSVADIQRRARRCLAACSAVALQCKTLCPRDAWRSCSEQHSSAGGLLVRSAHALSSAQSFSARARQSRCSGEGAAPRLALECRLMRRNWRLLSASARCGCRTCTWCAALGPAAQARARSSEHRGFAVCSLTVASFENLAWSSPASPL